MSSQKAGYIELIVNSEIIRVKHYSSKERRRAIMKDWTIELKNFIAKGEEIYIIVKPDK